jgi:tetratricopeptide (TPR) repeat protein
MNLLLISVVMAALSQAPPAIVQETTEWCRPAITHVLGKITVNCIGVDPMALQRLNAELSQKNLQLADTIREADEWAARYAVLAAQLNKAGDDSALSRQAMQYLRAGKLEKAGTVLDQILGVEEPNVDLVAVHQYNRAQLYELQFRPQDALPHFEKAYQYRSGDVQFGLGYAGALIQESNFQRAEPVLSATLTRARELEKTNPAAYRPYTAGTLNNLANLYSRIQRLKEAEAAYQEALQIWRELANTNPAAYRSDIAMTLDALGSLYRDTQRPKEAEAAYLETLDIDRELAQANPAAYQPRLSETLNNLAVLYKRTQRLHQAETAYQEALGIDRQLAKENPAAYQDHVALALNNLGNLYRVERRPEEAYAAYLEALEIRRGLAKADPAAYQPYLAGTLNNLALLYATTGRRAEAQSAYQESLDLYRRSAESNPAAYKPYVATALSNLAALHADVGSLGRAQTEIEEAVIIRREQWQANPEAAGNELAKSLIIQAHVLTATHQPPSVICPVLREARTVADDPELKEMAGDAGATDCKAP